MNRRSSLRGVRGVATATAIAIAIVGCTVDNSVMETSTSSTTTTATPSNAATSTTLPPPTPSLDPRDAISSLFTTDDPASSDIEQAAESVGVEELAGLLHDAVPFEAAEPGRTTVAALIGFNQRRQMVIRTPEGYDPDRAWPLIVMYHTWGGEADLIIDRLERLLGDAIEEYVVAAPDDYRQTVLDAPPPVSSEHVSLWRTVRSRWHIDADRMYLAGYSLGGDTVITLTAMHPGQVAGGLPMAAGLAFPSDVPGLIEAFLPNLRGVPMLHVYGAEDSFNIAGLNFRPQDITLAEQNELLDTLISDLGLSEYRQIRLEGIGHTGAYPTTDEALSVLAAPRPHLPEGFTHTFRYIHQADAFWVEGHEWEGQAWLTPWPEVTVAAGESEEEALNRTIFELLGTIDARIEDQTITVDTTHLADFTVWLHDGMVDWDQPVTLMVNGSEVFAGEVKPSASVALAQALRTYDFDRLRFAGIRVDVVAGTARLITHEDEFPPIARGITF